LVNDKLLKNHLKDVHFVPDIEKNLFSVGATVDKGITSTTDKDKCEFWRNGEVIAVAVRERMLFRMMLKVNPPEIPRTCEVNTVENLKTWHERLGHQGKDYV